MASTFEIGDIAAAPGTTRKGSVLTFRLADSQELRVPAVVVNGRGDGPTLLVVAGAHGREVSGIGALLDALPHLDPARMSGRVVAVTVANPLAVQIGSYLSPQDNVNLGALSYPPSPTGSVTNRIGAAIAQAVLAADYVIDMHANAEPSIAFVLTNCSLAPDERAREATKRFARAFGVTVIDRVAAVPSEITDFAVQHGKPGFVMELAHNRFLWPTITGVGTRGILNCAKSVGILPGDPEPQSGVTPILDGEYVAYGLLRVTSGGFLRVYKEPGEFIPAGAHVASVFDCYGDVVEKVIWPVDGYCWGFTCGVVSQTWALTAGDSIGYIFTKKA